MYVDRLVWMSVGMYVCICRRLTNTKPLVMMSFGFAVTGRRSTSERQVSSSGIQDLRNEPREVPALAMTCLHNVFF